MDRTSLLRTARCEQARPHHIMKGFTCQLLLAGVLWLCCTSVWAFERSSRIVGGDVVPDDRYPWMAALFSDPGQNGDFFQICGGSLIADRWIVTAAHCVLDDNSNVAPAGTFAVLLGSLRLTQGNGSLVPVNRVIVHPRFDPLTNLNDIALLQLSESFAATPLSLPSRAHPVPVVSEFATVAGWGLTGEFGLASSSLRQVSLTVKSHNTCFPYYTESLNRDAMICAGSGPAGGRDSCQGDSGGPLFVQRGNQSVLAGIVSYGWGCARPGVPGVYTRVSSYYDWISAHVTGSLAFESRPDQALVSLPDPALLTEADRRVSGSLRVGESDVFKINPVQALQLTTLSGDADLYVYSGPSFSQRSLLCSSFNIERVERCVLDAARDVYVQIFSIVDSSYEFTAFSGSGGQVRPVGLPELEVDTTAAGTVTLNTAQVYRVNEGEEIVLTSYSGNADLYLYADSDRTPESLLCLADTARSIEYCQTNGVFPVFAVVYGNEVSNYEIEARKAAQSREESVVSVQTASNVPIASSQQSGGGGGSSGWLFLLPGLLLLAIRRALQRRPAA